MMKTFSKKIWALLLAGVFLFSSIGCGSNGSAQTASADSVSTSDASLESLLYNIKCQGVDI